MKHERIAEVYGCAWCSAVDLWICCRRFVTWNNYVPNGASYVHASVNKLYSYRIIVAYEAFTVRNSIKENRTILKKKTKKIINGTIALLAIFDFFPRNCWVVQLRTTFFFFLASFSKVRRAKVCFRNNFHTAAGVIAPVFHPLNRSNTQQCRETFLDCSWKNERWSLVT